MIEWWSIEFIPSGAPGYMKMQDMVCIGVYTEDGTLIPPDAKIEYTCTATDVPPPPWA